MTSDPALDADTDRSNLPIADPNSSQSIASRCDDPEIRQRPNGCSFQIAQVAMHVGAASFEFQNRIADQLARPMIRDLAAARDSIDRDLARPLWKQEALIGGASEGEHMRMLEEQERVADFLALARSDHRGLDRERRAVIHGAEIRDAQCAGKLHHLYVNRLALRGERRFHYSLRHRGMRVGGLAEFDIRGLH